MNVKAITQVNPCSIVNQGYDYFWLYGYSWPVVIIRLQQSPPPPPPKKKEKKINVVIAFFKSQKRTMGSISQTAICEKNTNCRCYQFDIFGKQIYLKTTQLLSLHFYKVSGFNFLEFDIQITIKVWVKIVQIGFGFLFLDGLHVCCFLGKQVFITKWNWNSL